tara:strand:- start:268 stop:792 length:525 start_codon:yes stop_codon:yes gene_type:complete
MQKKIISLFLFIFIIFFLSILFISLNKITIYDTKDLVGKKITQIELIDFNSNKILTEKDFKKNKFTLINFWASWCAPCRKEHPALLQLTKAKNLNLIGVNFKDRKDDALNFLNQLGNPYDYLTKDEKGKQSINYGIYGIPESILLDENLIVIKKFIGPILKDDYEFIIKKIENL